MHVDKAISDRNGQVLLKDTLLKADHFPGSQNKTLVPSFKGAPNFRQIPELPIYGVAIPTVSGVKVVLDVLEAKSRKVLWHNLREEPLLFINGHPFVVRDADRPFANLEYTGIDRERVEAMEERLKQDVLAERRQYNGHVLLSGETDDMEIIQYWEEVAVEGVKTPQDVFRRFVHEEGYNVDYLRVPLTDEKAPKEADCDSIIERCWEPDEETALVFNCQMGRGRTTTGMIIATLLTLRRRGAVPGASIPSQIPEWFDPESDHRSNGDTSLKNGNYGAVRSLLRVLDDGLEAKRILDMVIDAADHMQNLRDAIYKYRERLCQEQNERKRNSILNVALEYLERYYILIAFSAFVARPAFGVGSQNCMTFETFMKQRPEFKSVLQRLLRRNPLSALGLHIAVEENDLKRVKSRYLNNYGSEITRLRFGNVLGVHAIMKEDQFPGIEAGRVRQVIDGAPNFRGVAEFPVYGVGMPTIDGIRGVLRAIGAGPGGENKSTPALWFNWREEPLVYINGRPFVLREDQRPFKNLKEYTDIDRIHLQKMEERLKEDILQEATQHDGSFLVTREIPSQSEDKGILEDKWEKLETEGSVETPLSVYRRLKQEGFAVEYHRLPLTDDRTPDVADVDEILSTMADHRGSSVIFNCQNGVGRTTVGMTIASLVYSQQQSSVAVEDRERTHRTLNSVNLFTRETPSVDSEKEDGLSDSTEERELQPLADENFLAVRRLTRLLENGSSSKRLVDYCSDLCSLLVNIRTETSQFRAHHHKPESRQRDIAHHRSVTYLHRYSFLIAVAAYITDPRQKQNIGFETWMQSRGEVRMALSFILHNPASALQILHPKPFATEAISSESVVSASEAQKYLSRRQFRVLNAQSILKGGRSTTYDTSFGNVPDLKRVFYKQVYTVGDPSVASLRKLLKQLQSDGTSSRHIVLRDIREELVVYVNGFPYRRRDLERPVSSLYHAGVAAEDLELMEETLCEDVKSEGRQHNGRILLHHELPTMTELSDEELQTGRNSLRAEDITHGIDDAEPAVVPTWRYVDVDGDVDHGIYTPRSVYEALSEEGYSLTYRRVPLSRARTPQASDFDGLKGSVEGSQEVVYVVISRSSTGSSARLAAAFFSLIHPSVRAPHRRRSISNRSSSKQARGEYRSITHLCRALPNGRICKAAVDEAIDDCARIGSLREDIFSCFSADGANSTTHQIGLHYLRRYFFLITHQCYRDHNHGECFNAWMNQRPELHHLLASIELD